MDNSRAGKVSGLKRLAGKPDKPASVLRGWWWRGMHRGPMMNPELFKGLTWRSEALKVDVDHQRKLSLLELADRLKKSNRRLSWIVECRSPSGRGWHRWIGVWPRPVSAVETVALQLLCGSDPHREAYNLNRARQVDAGTVSDYWTTRWNVLYRKERSV